MNSAAFARKPGVLNIVIDKQIIVTIPAILKSARLSFCRVRAPADHLISKRGRFPSNRVSAASKRTDELRRLLRTCKSYFVTAAMFSLAINLLYLAGPLYMLQVYDRVISSASEVTLVMLTIALLMAFMALAGLDAVRARVLTRASIRLDRRIAARIMTAIIDRSGSFGSARSQLLRDFDTFRQFITGAGIHAIFDLPWAPIYIAMICGSAPSSW